MPKQPSHEEQRGLEQHLKPKPKPSRPADSSAPTARPGEAVIARALAASAACRGRHPGYRPPPYDTRTAGLMSRDEYEAYMVYRLDQLTHWPEDPDL